MLVADRLSFGYRAQHVVLHEVSITLQPGRTVLLGPNGAGKSTLLRLLAGLASPNRGDITLNAQPASSGKLRQVAALMPQEVHPMAGLTVAEATQYAAWLGGLSRAMAKTMAAETLDAVGLTAKSDQRCDRLSGGQLRRLGLAMVLTRNPRILLLDEPTAGLDPAQRHRFRQVLAGLPAELIVLVSTHQIDDVVDLYDQVRIVAAGQVRWAGQPAELLALAGTSPQQAEHAYLQLVGED